MKKALLFVLCMLFLPLFALAEEAGFAAKWFEAQKAETIPAGIEAAIDERVYTLALPDGRDALSLCLTVEGDLRFGRYAQLVRTGLIDEATGEDVGLDAVFPDLDALQEFMDTYVEENVLDSLNTYLFGQNPVISGWIAFLLLCLVFLVAAFLILRFKPRRERG